MENTVNLRTKKPQQIQQVETNTLTTEQVTELTIAAVNQELQSYVTACWVAVGCTAPIVLGIFGYAVSQLSSLI